MTTPNVTELIRNGNPVDNRTAPAPIPSIGLPGTEDRRVRSPRRVASPPAQRTPVLQLAA